MSDLFSYLYRITGDDIFTVQGNLWSTYILSYNRRGGYKNNILGRQLVIFYMQILISIVEG